MPSRIRIADDGTIIRETVTTVTTTESRLPNVADELPIINNHESNDVDMSGAIVLPQAWWQTPASHWTITMAISAAISLIAFIYIAPLVFYPTGASGFFESIVNFFMIIAPYIILVSGIAGQVYYNKKFANKPDKGYTIKDYALSPFVSSGSVVTAGVGMVILTFVAAFAIAILLFILGIAILIGIVSGR